MWLKVASATSAIAAIFTAMAIAGPGKTQVASCDSGPVMVGSGSPNWRRESLDAGPVGVRLNPLRDMGRFGRQGKQLATKMPILVEGHEPVTVSVPPRLTHRMFLYYGSHEGPNGERSTSFGDYPGNSAVEFQPCADKPRTIWPGGIRLKGRRPVHLNVTVAGQPSPIRLQLGRPTAYDG